ncbi:MAG: hypothetical protein IIW17_07450, partial [Clostridia bacterium]|nr:hypothetical protein [Clostridia bacterium]
VNYAQMGQISPFMGNILPLKMQKSWKKTKISLFSLFLPRSGDLISVSPGGGNISAALCQAQGGRARIQSVSARNISIAKAEAH